MNVYIKDNFIKLQQALKLAGFVDKVLMLKCLYKTVM